MTNVSRPLIALLVATVAAFGVWYVALKPSSSSSGSSPGAYQNAIAAAHNAVATSAAASAAHGGTVLAAPAQTTTTPRAAVRPTSSAATAAQPTGILGGLTKAHRAGTASSRQRLTPDQRANLVDRALAGDKVVALLFYNPTAADDRAVKHELGSVPTHGRQVVKLAVPLTELRRYNAVTTHVMISQSPTLVLIDHSHAASMIVGFADRFEIAQRVSDALAGR